MIDAHVHLEKGPYTKEWIEQFIDTAVQRNINEIWFLEHTHIFKECNSLYKEMSKYNEYQSKWFEGKDSKSRPIREYIEFIESMKREKFPIKIRFGLEVCYSPQHEDDIDKIKRMYGFDFLVGSIHFIDGFAFSHLKQRWNKNDVDINHLYDRYYSLMMQLVKSGMFSGLAHPNSLQCFGAYPPKVYMDLYEELARQLHKSNMYIEESSGLAKNYGDKKIGMNEYMIKAMKENQVTILTASDAHYPSDVGWGIKSMDNILNK